MHNQFIPIPKRYMLLPIILLSLSKKYLTLVMTCTQHFCMDGKIKKLEHSKKLLLASLSIFSSGCSLFPGYSLRCPIFTLLSHKLVALCFHLFSLQPWKKCTPLWESRKRDKILVGYIYVIVDLQPSGGPPGWCPSKLGFLANY